MSYRAERITTAVKTKDRELFCKANEAGTLCVWRKGTRLERYVMDDNTTLVFARPAPHFVFALTDTWNVRGRAVDRGLEQILARIDEIDLWRRDLAKEIEEQYEKEQESKAREGRNSHEAFARELRPAFKKEFADINTASMAKTEIRRKREKSAHN